MQSEVIISSDKAKLDIGYIHGYLSRESYWAGGRSISEVKKTIENSICFGVYTTGGRQIGFARIITDYVVFAWLLDVFIDPAFRGHGYGFRLVRHILELESLQGVNGMGLRTQDAHGLYKKFGFGDIPNPDTWMYRKAIR